MRHGECLSSRLWLSWPHHSSFRAGPLGAVLLKTRDGLIGAEYPKTAPKIKPTNDQYPGTRQWRSLITLERHPQTPTRTLEPQHCLFDTHILLEHQYRHRNLELSLLERHFCAVLVRLGQS